MLGAASTEFNWNLNFGDIATIWRGGCIIRAKFLNRIIEAYERDPALHNLLLDSYFTDIIAEDAAQLARRGRDRGQARRGGAGLQRVARLFRQLSVRRVCPRICSRRSAISSARTPTSGSTSRASSTPNGWKQTAVQPKKQPRPKKRPDVTPANN